MTPHETPHPPIVSRDEWLVERRKLLGHEKEQTKHYDRVNAERRRLCDTTFAVVSRAPLAKLDAYKDQKKWRISRFSSLGSDFNYDFHVTLDPKVAPAEYNYRNKDEMAAAKGHAVLMEGEEHGLSVFFRVDDDMFHTYSAFARGTESLTDAYRLLDMTPYGRQQEFEDSPAGWPQHPTYG